MRVARVLPLMSFIFLLSTARAEAADIVKLVPIPVEPVGEQIRLAIESRAISSDCNFGEINAIDHERKQGSRSFRLVLAIEPLGGADFPSRAVELTELNLKEEFKTLMRLPRPKTDVYLRISLCSDWKSGMSCVGKPLTSLEEYFEGNDPKNKEIVLKQAKKTEEIFSRALLKINATGVWLLSQGAALSPELPAMSLPPYVAEEAMKSLFGVNQLVFSGTANGLLMTFHFRDRTRC